MLSTPHKQRKGEIETGTLVPRDGDASQHGVRFYENDAELCGVVASYISAGLRLNEPIIVVATHAHRAAFVQALRAHGAAPDEAVASGQLLLLDAETLLARFMVDGMPDWELFRDAAAELIDGVARRGRRACARTARWSTSCGAAATRRRRSGSRSCGATCSGSTASRCCAPTSWRTSTRSRLACRRSATRHDHVATATLSPGFEPGHAHALAAEIAQRKQVELVLRDSLHDLRRAQGELYRSQEQLRNSERQLQIITDTLPVLVGYVDYEQRYRSVNVFYEQWFGRPRAELIGMHVRDVLGEGAYAQARPHIDAALRGHAGHFEGVFQADDGERQIEVRYWPHLDPEGRARATSS